MSTEESWIGSTIDGRYVITKRIARGGMSTVYLARDERLHRDVAVKVLFPHMAEDRKVVQRFEQEARTSALISHPNVVQVLDQGQTRETAYMVMEYVPGATLRTLLKSGPMTPRLTLAYTQAILAGLAAAHRAGLVHRDIKPENVLVSPEGRIKLADFGLARAATHHSGTSTLMGTVAYISPELLSGEGADERADIYAVGILLYEMLTGVQPYTGDSPVRVAFQHVNSTVPAPSSYVPGLPQALDELVREATRTDPAERPKNADALLDMLQEVREQLSDEELDFDGAARKHRRHHGTGAPTATAAMPAAAAAATAADSAHTPETPSPAEDDEDFASEDKTVVFGGEDFPTAEDRTQWDDDATTVLGQTPPGAQKPGGPPAPQDYAPPRPQAPQPAQGTQGMNEPWSALAEQDRQTVAEVPLPGQLSVHDDDTTATPVTAAADPRASKRERQRPKVELSTPDSTRQAVAVAILMILSAVLMLLAYQLGINSSLIPSLGGG
ncbi:protein kinase [Nesterenkonia massiliensis]|uniref:Protein kinase n=1 Tax=Nesterenkonia massiliensis TaxID=1232429 RepID=A0ABT2HQJ3_9MICC|nr:protein kinase [Nesterenkonia massiliensis]MCT1606944.1 protein kinase [Nesterenkonia massiliensis]